MRDIFFDHAGMKVGWFLVFMIITILFSTYLIFGIIKHTTVDAEIAGFEVLRSNFDQSTNEIADHVMGQAVKANRNLVELKQLDKIFFLDPLIPDKWLIVEPIQVR